MFITMLHPNTPINENIVIKVAQISKALATHKLSDIQHISYPAPPPEVDNHPLSYACEVLRDRSGCW